MVSVGPIRIGNAILCDDARQEATNNKYFLIGVYSGDMILSQIPVDIQLAFYLEITAPKGHYDMEVRLSGPQEGGAIIPVSFDHSGTGVATLASPRIGLTMTEEGTFKIDLRVGKGRWTNIISKKVSVDPNALLPPFGQSRPDALELASQP